MKNEASKSSVRGMLHSRITFIRRFVPADKLTEFDENVEEIFAILDAVPIEGADENPYGLSIDHYEFDGSKRMKRESQFYKPNKKDKYADAINKIFDHPILKDQ